MPMCTCAHMHSHDFFLKKKTRPCALWLTQWNNVNNQPWNKHIVRPVQGALSDHNSVSKCNGIIRGTPRPHQPCGLTSDWLCISETYLTRNALNRKVATKGSFCQFLCEAISQTWSHMENLLFITSFVRRACRKVIFLGLYYL